MPIFLRPHSKVQPNGTIAILFYQQFIKLLTFHVAADPLTPQPEQFFAMQPRRDAESLHALTTFQVFDITPLRSQQPKLPQVELFQARC